MYTYNTVSEAIAELKKRGFTYDYAIQSENECLVCHKTGLSLSPIDFVIDEIHRFEGDSDPGDEMIVYAISSEKYKMKGIVVNAFGIYADSKISKIVALLHRHKI